MDQPALEGSGSEQGQAQPIEQKQEYMTRQEAQALMRQLADEAFRKAQGLTDKTASRIEKQVADRVSELEKTLGPLSDEQKRRIQETSAPAAVEVQAPAAAAGATDVDQQTEQIYQKFGLTLEENDPEAKGLDYSTPAAFLSSLEAAVADKARRIKPPAVVRMAAATVGRSAGNPLQSVNDPGELWRLARERTIKR